MDKNTHTYQFSFPVGKWRTWFAWYPVITWDGRFMFLRIVERRLQQMYEHLDGGRERQWFEYHKN